MRQDGALGGSARLTRLRRGCRGSVGRIRVTGLGFQTATELADPGLECRPFGRLHLGEYQAHAHSGQAVNDARLALKPPAALPHTDPHAAACRKGIDRVHVAAGDTQVRTPAIGIGHRAWLDDAGHRHNGVARPTPPLASIFAGCERRARRDRMVFPCGHSVHQSTPGCSQAHTGLNAAHGGTGRGEQSYPCRFPRRRQSFRECPVSSGGRSTRGSVGSARAPL